MRKDEDVKSHGKIKCTLSLQIFLSLIDDERDEKELNLTSPDVVIKYYGEIVVAVPSSSLPPNHAPHNHILDNDVEEVEIFDEKFLGGEVGKKQMESDVEYGEIEVK